MGRNGQLMDHQSSWRGIGDHSREKCCGTGNGLAFRPIKYRRCCSWFLCIANILSLLSQSGFPALLSRESGQKALAHQSVFAPSCGPAAAENNRFPAFFPASREIRFGEGFASDCIIHHSVLQFSDISQNPRKSARVRAISYQRMDNAARPRRKFLRNASR